MKVLLLIIVISNPEAVCLNGTFFTREIVSSKEEAAMILKTKNTEKTDVYDDFAGKLYEVDLTNNTVKLIYGIDRKDFYYCYVFCYFGIYP